MSAIISCIALSLITFISSTSAQNCGADCKSCTDLGSCDLDPNCFYVVDAASGVGDGSGSCEIAGTCASNCALCSEAECDSGAGGGVCLFNPNTGCFGSTCNTDCQNCDALSNECFTSRAPPFGCVEDGDVERCVPKVPTMAPTEIPTVNPSQPPIRITPSPVTPAPVTPSPVLPPPVTPSPIIITPFPTTPAPIFIPPPMTPRPSVPINTPMPSVPFTSTTTTTDYLRTTDSDSMETTDESDSMETTDDSVSSESDSVETTDFDSMDTTEGDSDSDSDSMETTDDSSSMETTSDSDSDSDSVDMDTTDVPMATTDSASVDDGSASIDVDTDKDESSGGSEEGSIEVESDDEPQAVNEADDELDADDMRRNRGVDGFGKNGLSSGKGKGSTNIVGAVLGVLGMFVFVGIVSGVWFYCKSKEKAFVSVNVIDLDDHVHGHDDNVHDERTVMMAEVNEGHAITICEDE